MSTPPLVAVEEHWMPAELTAALRALPPGERDDSLAFNDRGDHLDLLEDLGDDRLARMDAQGIGLAVLALTPPATQALPPADAVRLGRVANDAAAAAVAAHPSRLRAWATLPLSSPADAVAELERAAGLGLVGAMVHPRARGVPLDDPVHDRLFATAAALRQPIFLHPQLPSADLREAAYRGFDPATELAMATFGWGWHVDAATAALRLILRGTFDRHPDLQLVLGHWGELLLFWLDRADSLSRVAGLRRPVSDYVRTNVTITMSGMLDPALLTHALAVTTVDRLVFSTDFPFQQPDATAVARFLDRFDTDADRDRVRWHNAAALLGLPDDRSRVSSEDRGVVPRRRAGT